MLARLTRSRALLDDAALTRFDHALIVLPFGRDADALPEFPQRARLEAALRRRKMKFEDLGKTPLALHLEHGGLCAYVMVDRNKPRFEQLTTLALAIAWWFRNIVSAQIAQIDQAIRAIGRGDYADQITVSGPDDLAFLGQRLDWLRQRLGDLEEQKSRFLRHVSHDLKTPLTAIREGAQRMADEVPGPINEGQRTIVGIMTQNSLRLQALIEERLNYQQASLAAGKLEMKPVALEVLADQVLLTHRLAAESRAIHVQKVLPPVQVEGDAEKLRVVIDNLVTNAIKFLP